MKKLISRPSFWSWVIIAAIFIGCLVSCAPAGFYGSCPTYGSKSPGKRVSKSMRAQAFYRQPKHK